MEKIGNKFEKKSFLRRDKAAPAGMFMLLYLKLCCASDPIRK
ncbi:hypothetical protein SynBIOSU31_01840 [Synechococcus sp. BIOS-U3-1]|nr:hypothetical protein SynBIOSU31_01840 [Synechococcus sp. BIOS-U3-1]